MTSDSTPTPRRSRLGLIAFLIAIVALIVGGAALFLAGRTIGGIAEFVDIAALTESGAAIDPDALSAEARALIDTASTQRVIGYIVWIALALWALAQGIFAIVRRRGRGWGLAAVLVAVVSWFVVELAYTAGVAIGAAPFVVIPA